MTPAELARRLDRRFAVLAGGRRGAVERHQTLRAAIDWSFDLLTGAEQALLGRLTVFAGGCTLEAAEAVCGGGRIDAGAVFGLLASLVAQSLVVAEDKKSETRYRLLEPIRQYGEEHLDGVGETERWRARHAFYYYADFLRQVRDHGRDPGGRRVLGGGGSAPSRTTCLRPGRGRSAPATSASRSRSWQASRPARSGRATCCCSSATRHSSCSGATEHPGYPLALAVSAMFASNRADVTGAEEFLPPGRRGQRTPGHPDWRVAVTVCATRSNIASATGAATDAARLAEQAARYRSSRRGDLADASVELTIAAIDHRLAGDAPAAVPLASQALALARQAGAPALIATSLLALRPRRSQRPTPARPAPTCAKAASSARHSATRTPSTSSGRPGSRCRSATGPPCSSLAAVPSAPCSETVTAAGWAASCT